MVHLVSLVAVMVAALDPSLQPPGAVLAASTQGGGVQVYECRIGPNGAPAWTFVEPEAALFDDTGRPFGTHGSGPTWKANDGSQIAADAQTPLARVAQPGAVPELLLKVTSATGSGVLSGVRYVQRSDTVGGVAPADGCDTAHVGGRTAVRYAATYRFFK